MNVSVAMATFNGEKYIVEQLESILNQLSEHDEIIISDDGSTDGTREIVKQLQKKSKSTIEIVDGPQMGVFKNFENAIQHCRNEIIFLSDQDDIWMPGKIRIITDVFKEQERINLVLHNGYQFDDNEKLDRLINNYKSGIIKNIYMSSYWGCCMAFRKSFIWEYIPFRCKPTAHDQLIGLLSEDQHSTVFLDDDLIAHRVHGMNQTRRRHIIDRIIFRARLFNAFMACKKG